MSGQRPGMFSGLGGVLAHGMAFGAGSEVAHRAVGGMMGDNRGQPVIVEQGGQPAYQQQYNQGQQEQTNKCQFESTQFIQCLKDHDNQIGDCQDVFEKLKVCEKSAI